MPHSVSAHMCFRGQKCGENARFRCTRVSINGIEFWGKSQIQANEKQSRDRVFADVLSILKLFFQFLQDLAATTSTKLSQFLHEISQYLNPDTQHWYQECFHTQNFVKIYVCGGILSLFGC